MKANPLHLGAVLGFVFALFHAGWSGLVASGWAQQVLDFLFWAHFITPVYHVESFELTRAAILVGVTFGVGVILGVVIALVWNRFVRIAK